MRDGLRLVIRAPAPETGIPWELTEVTFLLLHRFLASLQRLNVTITRAKYSLFILGHLRTLMVGTFCGGLQGVLKLSAVAYYRFFFRHQNGNDFLVTK